MSYEPDDQRVNFRQVLAGWCFCLALVGVALATTGYHRAMSSADPNDRPPIAEAGYSMNGVQLPTFAACAPDRGGAVAMVRERGSVTTNPCG
jgi:hypothetical protein